MKKIIFYYRDGRVVEEHPLNRVSIEKSLGMKVKCTLIDGSQRVGFSNPFYSFEKGKTSAETHGLDYITLETFVNLDENTHTFIGEGYHKYDINREAVPISLISRIDAILYSGLRWGGIPTNLFNLKINS